MTTNATLVREYVCAQCHGPVVEKYLEGQFTVVCPKGCTPGGFVTRTWAERRRAESAAELTEVARLYPQLDPRLTRTPEQRRKALSALYGQEE